MSKIIVDIQEKAKKYITKNQFNDALKLLNEFIGNYDLRNSPIEKHLILISKEYFDIREKGINGILSHDEVRRIESNLTSRFLILVNDLEELKDEDLSAKNDVGGGIVSADYYLNTEINYIISQIISSDDKINDLKITIEDKRVEITRTKNNRRTEILKKEINKLKQDLEKEKENFSLIKLEYDALKSQYEQLTKKENGQHEKLAGFCKNCSLELEKDTKCSSCGYENDDLKMIRHQLESLKIDYGSFVESDKEQRRIYDEYKNTSSMILQYLDDLNRRLIMIEKKIK